MKTKTIKTTTAPAIAGGNPALEAVIGYQTYRKNPSPENWEVFGIKLDQLLKCALPRTTDDQRQEAIAILIEAPARLERAACKCSMHGAKLMLKLAQKSLGRAKTRIGRKNEQQKRIKVKAEEEKHRSLDQPHTEDARLRKAATKVIAAAESGKLIKPKDAKLLLRLLRDEVSRKEIAAELGISEAAVSLRIKRILPMLQKLADEIEI
jgi:hypothetical protein